MFDTSQKSSGSVYTTTIAFLAVAFLFIPAGLVVSRPFGYVTLSLAIAGSALCVALAWITWKKSARLSTPSIASQEGRTK